MNRPTRVTSKVQMNAIQFFFFDRPLDYLVLLTPDFRLPVYIYHLIMFEQMHLHQLIE